MNDQERFKNNECYCEDFRDPKTGQLRAWCNYCRADCVEEKNRLVRENMDLRHRLSLLPVEGTSSVR